MPPAVRIWLVHTHLSADRLDALADLLDAAERARAAEITEPATHAEFVVSHAAARQILGRLLEVPPGSLRWRHGPSGKPSVAAPLTDLQVSLSHSDGLAAVAVSTGRPVGVDVQGRRSAAGLVRMAERYYPAAEAEFVSRGADEDEVGRRFSTLWTRKEACAKVAGGRLIPALAWPSRPLPGSPAEADPGQDPDRVDPGRAGAFLSGDPATGEPVVVRDLAVPAGFHGAVALAGRGTFAAALHWWAPESHCPPQVAAAPASLPTDHPGVPMVVSAC